jgi:hypothetical protein
MSRTFATSNNQHSMLQLQQVWTQIPRLPRAQSLCTFLGADVNADATAQGTSYSTAGATADPHDLNASVPCASISRASVDPHDPNVNLGDLCASI